MYSGVGGSKRAHADITFMLEVEISETETLTVRQHYAAVYCETR